MHKLAMYLDLKIGDVILSGRYKNKREVVETIQTDELGQPVVNGKKLLTCRLEKKLPKKKWSRKSIEFLQKKSKEVKISQGIHYAKDGTLPANMFNLSKKTQKEIYNEYKKQLTGQSVSDQLATKRTDKYITDRKLMERLLKEIATDKLGKDIVEHPLYFRTDDTDVAWGDKINTKSKYRIHPDLLDSATYYPGDSFDAMRGASGNEDVIRKELMSRLLTRKNYNNRDGRTLRLKKRKHGNYIEGQLWAPYDIVNNEIVPKQLQKASADKSQIMRSADNNNHRGEYV